MTLPFGLGVLGAAAPRVLWLLAALPIVFAAAGPGRRARRAAALRAAAAAALVAVLAGVHLETRAPASGVCLVAAVDGSASVQAAAVDRARATLARLLPALGGDDLVGAVVFGARPHVTARPTSAARLDDLLPATALDDADAADTDVAAALTQAAAPCPAARQAAILLFSDGNETRGSALAEAALGEPTVPVFSLPPADATLPPVVVRRLLAPTFAPAGAVLPLEAVVENRTGAALSAAVQVTANGRAVPDEPDGRSAQLQIVAVPPGLAVLPLPYRLAEPGQYRLEVRLLLPPDLPPAPATATAAIAVTPPVHVLIVSGRAVPVVATALAERGMRAETVPPAALAGRLPALAATHLVILDDVGRAGLDDTTLAALAAWVEGGGGLVVTGGPHLFGDAGFAGTALERILPVELQSQAPEPREREPIALYLLIDRSNSMGYASGPDVGHGDKMTYAKRAALAMLEQLGDEDLVGGVAFDSAAHELTPLAPVRDVRADLATRIQQLQYGGGTDFKDALELALQQLAAAPRRVRHVILLTDGDTNRRAEDHADVIAALARVDVTVTTIRIGSDTANLELLDTMARATGGQFHHAARVDVLPQLLISDTRRQLDLAAGRTGLPVRAGEPGPMLAGLRVDELPPVARWAVTRLRPDAELRLWVDTSERRDPVLATWQVGLGRVAALPLDFQAGAAAWAAWPGFAKLWTQLATWAIPAARPGDRRLTAAPAVDGTHVVLETAVDERGPFTLEPAGPGSRVPLHATGARRWEGALPALPAGPSDWRLRAADDPPEDVTLVVPAATPSGRELRARGTNLRLLAHLARATGGRVDPSAADVLAARGGAARRTVPLAPWLVPLALACVLADIATRDGKP